MLSDDLEGCSVGGKHRGWGNVCTHIADSCCCIAETNQHRKAIMCCALCLVAQSCLTLCDPMDYCLSGSPVHGNSPGKNTGLSCHALLQRIFPTQGSNPGLPHCKRILYQLSHQGSPRILDWVAYPFSRASS